MIDITNDKFWEAEYEIKRREPKKTNILGTFIHEHKIISASLICLGICVIMNACLIYSFFKILNTL